MQSSSVCTNAQVHACRKLHQSKVTSMYVRRSRSADRSNGSHVFETLWNWARFYIVEVFESFLLLRNRPCDLCLLNRELSHYFEPTRCGKVALDNRHITRNAIAIVYILASVPVLSGIIYTTNVIACCVSWTLQLHESSMIIYTKHLGATRQREK